MSLFTMNPERRARIIVWLYSRYVVRPYLKEQARAAQELADLLGDEIEIVLELETPTIH